jgi:CheY-like chemotaxis protein
MPLSTVHLIVVEDDDVDVESVVRSLNRNGIFGEITVFRDGLEALRALQGDYAFMHSRPLLILLDLDLPRLNGLEFLDALRSDPRLCGTTVFVLTLSDRKEDKLAAYDRQVAGYLLKSTLGENFALLPKLLRSYCRLVAPSRPLPPALPASTGTPTALAPGLSSPVPSGMQPGMQPGR